MFVALEKVITWNIKKIILAVKFLFAIPISYSYFISLNTCHSEAPPLYKEMLFIYLKQERVVAFFVFYSRLF